MSMTNTFATPLTALHLDRPAYAPIALPRRVDVHRIDEVVEVLTERAAIAGVVDVDGGDVEMIDLAGLRGLERLATDVDLRIHGASVALAATAEFTRHETLLAACSISIDEALAA